MSVSFYLYVRRGKSGFAFPEAVSGKTCREIIPDSGTPEYITWLTSDEEIPNPNYDYRLDINVNQRNAKLILNELGFLGIDLDVDNAEPVPLAEFEAALTATIARNRELIHGIPATVDKTPGKATFIDCGTADGYVNDRLNDLVKLVEAAKEYGATYIGWG